MAHCAARWFGVALRSRIRSPAGVGGIRSIESAGSHSTPERRGSSSPRRCGASQRRFADYVKALGEQSSSLWMCVMDACRARLVVLDRPQRGRGARAMHGQRGHPPHVTVDRTRRNHEGSDLASTRGCARAGSQSSPRAGSRRPRRGRGSSGSVARRGDGGSGTCPGWAFARPVIQVNTPLLKGPFPLTSLC